MDTTVLRRIAGTARCEWGFCRRIAFCERMDDTDRWVPSCLNHAVKDVEQRTAE